MPAPRLIETTVSGISVPDNDQTRPLADAVGRLCYNARIADTNVEDLSIRRVK